MNCSNLPTIYILLFLIMQGWVSCLHGQTVIPDKHLIPEDNEKIETIENINQEARDIFLEAEAIYTRMEDLKEEENLNDESEKIQDLRKKALQKDIEGYEKKKEANRMLYKIYKKHLEKLEEPVNKAIDITEARLKYEKAREFFYRASILRNDAYNQVEDLRGKFDKLKKAQKMEALGFDNLENAAKRFFSAQNDKEQGSVNNSRRERNVIIDKDLLNNIKMTLHQYSYETTLYEKLNQIRLNDTISFDKVISIINKRRRNITAKESITDTVSGMPGMTAKNNLELNDFQEKQAEKGKDGNGASKPNDSTTSSSEKRKYRLEIAVEKSSLSQNTLKKLYEEDKKILEIEENGWKKYSVGEFNTYNQAAQFRENLSVPDAFIVASNDENSLIPDDVSNQNQNSVSVDEQKNQDKLPANPSSKNDHADIVFKVQIAAGRKQLSKEKLTEIYNGKKDISMNKIEGWYKYSLGSFNRYQAAERLRKKVDVSGAFVTAYRGDNLLNLKQAINRKQTTSEHKTLASAESGKLTYKVQIAADRIQLESSKLNSIYSGIKKVHLNRDNGWFRYSVGNCPTYYHAQQLKNRINVKGSWVVAYKDGQRLNAYKRKTYPDACPPLNLKRNKKPTHEIVFRVQVVASELQLSANNLKYFYCGDKVVTEIKEGRYYKYSVGNYDNYQDAASLKREICVPGAFVVAFKNNQPLKVQSAIKQNK